MSWNGGLVMTATKHRPTFRIIENPIDEIDMTAFEKDYLDPTLNAKDLRKKYSIGIFRYSSLAKEVREKHGLFKKPYQFKCADGSSPTFNGKFLSNRRYIRKWRNTYSIQKTINGEKHTCGVFHDLETAQEVRDYLLNCDWDIDEFNRLKDKYKYDRTAKCYNKAVEKYPIWKEFYFNSLMPMDEINKMLNITTKMYLHLVGMIRDEYGIDKRPSKLERMK